MHLQQQDQQPKKLPPNKLREIRRTLSQNRSQDRPAGVELLHYGAVTLIHKKLDSWIDSKPPDLHDKYTCQDDVLTVEDSESDHLQRRVQCMTKKRGRLARSWSGNMSMVPRTSHHSLEHHASLIDAHPSKAEINKLNDGSCKSIPKRGVHRAHSLGTASTMGRSTIVMTTTA